MEHDKLLKVISAYLAEWGLSAQAAEEFIAKRIAAGDNLEKVVDAAIRKYPKMFYLSDLPEILADAAAIGMGVDDPKYIPEQQRSVLINALKKPWTADGVILSARLYATGRDMRSRILSTVGQSIKEGKDWVTAARTLYSGYGRGKIIPDQEIALYMAKIRRWSPENSEEQRKIARRALRNINCLARNGAPNVALKSAYKKLIDAAISGSKEAFQKALHGAIAEKSRYAAERITRTESSRAWADGFFHRALQDSRVVAFKWRLSSRHPVHDICDLYVAADMHNLGRGVYPRDKVPPLPAHPHCLCYLTEVFRSEVDLTKESDKIDAAVKGWLGSLPEKKLIGVLGIRGKNEFASSGSWAEHLRGWKGLARPTSRFDKDFIRELMKRNLIPPDDEHLEMIAKKYNMRYTRGKIGYERWFSDDNKPIYPLYDGFYGEYEVETLRAGSVIVDRYGRATGRFVSPAGTPFEARSLPDESKKETLHVYRITKDIPGVLSGRTAPWFDQPGGGWQYKLPTKIIDLGDFLEEVYGYDDK